jgi:hypothetical protein
LHLAQNLFPPPPKHGTSPLCPFSFCLIFFYSEKKEEDKKKEKKGSFEENGTNKKRQKDGRKITLRGQEDAILGNPLNGFDEEITDSQTVAESLSQLLERDMPSDKIKSKKKQGMMKKEKKNQ